MRSNKLEQTKRQSTITLILILVSMGMIAYVLDAVTINKSRNTADAVAARQQSLHMQNELRRKQRAYKEHLGRVAFAAAHPDFAKKERAAAIQTANAAAERQREHSEASAKALADEQGADRLCGDADAEFGVAKENDGMSEDAGAEWLKVSNLYVLCGIANKSAAPSASARAGLQGARAAALGAHTLLAAWGVNASNGSADDSLKLNAMQAMRNAIHLAEDVARTHTDSASEASAFAVELREQYKTF